MKLGLEDLFSSICSESNPSSISISSSFIVSSLLVTPCEQFIIAGCRTGNILIWSLTDSPSLLHSWIESPFCINSILCSPTYTIFAGNEKGEILSWNFLKNLKQTFRTSKYAVTCLELLSNGSIICASRNGFLEIWSPEFSNDFSLSAHEEEINCMRLSNNEKNLYTGGSDHRIKVWEINENEAEEVRNIEDVHESEVIVMELLEEKLVSGDFNGILIVWDLEDFEVLHKLELDEPFKCIFKSNDSRYLFTASQSTEKIRIKIWNLSKIEEKPYAIKNAHTGAISSLFFMQKSGSLVSVGEEKVIKIWNFSNHVAESWLLQKPGISAMLINKNTLIYNKSPAFKFKSLPDCRELKSLKSDIRMKILAINSDNSVLAHDSPINTVYIWRLRLYSEPYFSFAHPNTVTCIHFIDSDTLLTGCADGICRVWSLIFQRLEHEFPQDSSIIDLKCVQKYIYIGNIEGVISIWRRNDFSLKKKVEYKAKLMTLAVSEGGVIVGAGESNLIKLWRWKLMKHKAKPEELSGHKDSIFKVIVQKNVIFSASFDKTIKIWSLDLRMLYFSISLEHSFTEISVDTSMEFIYCLSSAGIFYIANPMKSDKIMVYPFHYSWLYLKYLKKLFQNKTKVFDENWVDYVIFPHIVNLLYIFIKSNHPELLKQAITSHVKFLQDQNGDSPLSVALNWRNYKCADVMIKSLSKMKLRKEHGIIQSIEGCMNKIINSNLSQLPKFFESLFPVNTSRLILYAELLERAPMIIQSKSSWINEVRFIDYEGRKKEQVEFRSSLVRFDFVAGSVESMQLMRAISHSNNADFFRTAMLKALLYYKWNQVYYILLGEAAVYAVIMFLVTLLTIEPDFYVTALVVLGVLNTVMLAKEAVHFIEFPKKYAKDVWNYIDLSRILCTYIFIVLTPFDMASVSLKQILTIFYWARAVAYFRIFNKTRYLIRMIIETFIDIIPFLLIFFTATFTFAMLFYISTGSSSLSQTFLYSYQLNFNDFSGFLPDDDWNSHSLMFWVIFFISSIMNPIILLNMLIAIMSDTYDRVQEDQVVADCKEMAGLIIQAEGVLFWKRKSSKIGYIQKCDYVRHLAGEEIVWNGKIRAIKKTITRLQLKARNNDKKLNMMQNKVLFKVREIKASNEQISKKIAEMEGTGGSNKSNSSFIE